MLSPTGVHPALHISAIRTRFVKVPKRFPPGTSATTVNSAPLLLVDLETREGVVGHSYLFCYRESGAKAIADIVQEAAGLIDGMAVTPMKLMDFLAKQYTLLGVAGVARMALVCFQKLRASARGNANRALAWIRQLGRQYPAGTVGRLGWLHCAAK